MDDNAFSATYVKTLVVSSLSQLIWIKGDTGNEPSVFLKGKLNT